MSYYHFIVDLFYFDLHMHEAKLYTLWFIYIDKDSNNVLMCSISNMRFSDMTFTYCAITLLFSGTVSILWLPTCFKIILNLETNAFIQCVKEASDGASTDLVRDTRFPFSAAASGKPHELSHIKGNLDQIFLSVSHDDIQPLFSLSFLQDHVPQSCAWAGYVSPFAD